MYDWNDNLCIRYTPISAYFLELMEKKMFMIVEYELYCDFKIARVVIFHKWIVVYRFIGTLHAIIAYGENPWDQSNLLSRK